MSSTSDWTDDADLHPEGPSMDDLERFDRASDTCPSCGNEIYADTALCPVCGFALDDRVDAAPGVMKPWIIAVALVLALVFAGFGAVLF